MADKNTMEEFRRVVESDLLVHVLTSNGATLEEIIVKMAKRHQEMEEAMTKQAMENRPPMVIVDVEPPEQTEPFYASLLERHREMLEKADKPIKLTANEIRIGDLTIQCHLPRKTD